MTIRPTCKTPLLAGLLALLCGCGADAAGTAATAGAIKKNEMEQGRVVQEQVQQQLHRSLEQTQQRTDQLEQATR